MDVGNVEGWIGKGKRKWKGKGKGKGEGKGKGKGFQGGFKGKGKGRGGNWKGRGKGRGYGRGFGRGRGKGGGKSYGKYNPGSADGVCHHCGKYGRYEAQDLGTGDFAWNVEGDQQREGPSGHEDSPHQLPTQEQQATTGKVPAKEAQVHGHQAAAPDNGM